MRGAADHGWSVGKIEGKKGDYSFTGTKVDADGDTEVSIFKEKKYSIKAHHYKGGVEFYDVADYRGAIPPAQARVQEAFKVGEYTVVPNYVDGTLDHYTTSLELERHPENNYETAYRYDYIIGRDKLDHFIENYSTYAGGANLAFGTRLHLYQWQIDYALENYGDAYLGYLKQQWSDPITIVQGATTFVLGATAIRPSANRPKFRRVTYDARLFDQTDTYHNFPKSFEKHIIKKGTWSQRVKDGAHWFEMKGTINGTSGTYQIGINSEGKIFHKNFVPDK